MTVCGSMWQCVALCVSVWQCVAVVDGLESVLKKLIFYYWSRSSRSDDLVVLRIHMQKRSMCPQMRNLYKYNKKNVFIV